MIDLLNPLHVMKIVIEPYTGAWTERFRQEETRITAALAALGPAVEHIGSTSVPGLGAKPIVDILVGVQNEQQLDETIAPMLAAGYTYFKKYEPAMPYRRFYVHLQAQPGKQLPAVVDIPDSSPVGNGCIALTHIHTVVKDTYHWQRHIAFRDYLRTHAAAREAYYRLKQELSLREFSDALAYNDAKNAFVKQTEQEALTWWLKANPQQRDT